MLEHLSKKSIIILTIVSLVIAIWIVYSHYYYSNNDDETIEIDDEKIEIDDNSRQLVVLEDSKTNSSSNANTTTMGMVKLLPHLMPYNIFDWIKQSVALLLIFLITFMVISIVFMTVFMVTSHCIAKRVEKRLNLVSNNVQGEDERLL